MERLGPASVTCAYACAVREEELNNLRLMRGGSDVQSRVAPIDVVVNRSQEVSVVIIESTGRKSGS